MNPETKELLRAKISELDGLIDTAKADEAVAKEAKDKAIAIHQTCLDKLNYLKIQKQKIKEDLPTNG